MRKSAKNQQSQVQKIKRTLTGKKESQDNSNINNFWKGNGWFYPQCLRTLCYFLRSELRKWLFGKLYLCPSIQLETSSYWPSVLHSLHALSVAVLVITANSADRVNYAKT